MPHWSTTRNTTQTSKEAEAAGLNSLASVSKNLFRKQKTFTEMQSKHLNVERLSQLKCLLQHFIRTYFEFANANVKHAAT